MTDMADMEVTSVVQTSTSPTSLLHLQYAFVIVICVFVCMLPCLSSRKSWADAVSARKVLAVMRLCIFAQYVLNAFSFFCVVAYGPPFFTQYTAYGNGSSWLYGYGRPVMGIVFFGFGGVADMHPGPRYICLLACMHQLVCDAFSSFQVHAFIRTVNHFNAPLTAGYTFELMQLYYWRDVCSFANSLFLLLLTAHITSIIGLCNPPFLRYTAVEGEDLDRVSMMHKAYYSVLDAMDAKQGKGNGKGKGKATGSGRGDDDTSSSGAGGGSSNKSMSVSSKSRARASAKSSVSASAGASANASGKAEALDIEAGLPRQRDD